MPPATSDELLVKAGVPRDEARRLLEEAVTPAHLLALLEERGYATAAEALRHRLGLPQRRAGELRKVVVFEDMVSGGEVVSVAVDEEERTYLCVTGGRRIAWMRRNLGRGEAAGLMECWLLGGIFEALAVGHLVCEDMGMSAEARVVDTPAYRRLAYAGVTGARWGRSVHVEKSPEG